MPRGPCVRLTGERRIAPAANLLFIITTAKSRSRNDAKHHALAWEGRTLPDISVTRICLVTEELSYAKGSGGIGGAFHELVH